jgi:ATP-dependent exoDNAse (exonuclease V) beta subunit
VKPPGLSAKRAMRSTPMAPCATMPTREEVYDTERHLLYIACTRARDHLLVTGIALPQSSWTT